AGGAGTWDINGFGADYTPGPNESGALALSFCAVSNCGDTACAPFALAVQGGPTASITPNGPTAICAGSSVTLTASGGTSYQWSTGASTPSV
ncbi:MAG: hypothetical protein ACK4L7_08235, partial [Flavobacteriales bacterium]